MSCLVTLHLRQVKPSVSTSISYFYGYLCSSCSFRGQLFVYNLSNSFYSENQIRGSPGIQTARKFLTLLHVSALPRSAVHTWQVIGRGIPGRFERLFARILPARHVPSTPSKGKRKLLTIGPALLDSCSVSGSIPRRRNKRICRRGSLVQSWCDQGHVCRFDGFLLPLSSTLHMHPTY